MENTGWGRAEQLARRIHQLTTTPMRSVKSSDLGPGVAAGDRGGLSRDRQRQRGSDGKSAGRNRSAGSHSLAGGLLLVAAPGQKSDASHEDRAGKGSREEAGQQLRSPPRSPIRSRSATPRRGCLEAAPASCLWSFPSGEARRPQGSHPCRLERQYRQAYRRSPHRRQTRKDRRRRPWTSFA